MRTRYRLIPAVLLILVAVSITAATVTATWQNATQNTDNTAIPATGPGSIASTRVEWSLCAAGDTFGTEVVGEKVVAGTITTLLTPDLAPGRWCFRAIHVNTYGSESAPSNIAVKTIAAPKPKAPGNFSIS